MTIAKLVVEVEGRLNSLQDAITKATRLASNFERDMQRTLTNDRLFAGLSSEKLGSVSKVFENIKKEAEATIKNVNAQFQAGFLKSHEAKSQIEGALSSMFTSMQREIQGFSSSGFLGPDAVRKLEDVGTRGGIAMGQSFTRNAALTDRIAGSLSGATLTFERESSRIKERLFRGLIDENEARKQGGIAAAAFNDSWLRTVDQITRDFKVPESVRRMLVDQLKPQGIGFGQAITAQERAIEAAGSQISKLQDNLKTSLARNKLDLSEQIIDPKKFNQRAELAMAEFRKGVQSARVDLTGRNLLTSDVEQQLASSLTKAETLVRRSKQRIVDENTAAAKASVQAFTDTYNRTIANAKLQTTQGKLDNRGFVKAANDAKTAFNNSLEELRRDLDSKGLLTDEAKRLIDRQFKQAGEAAGNGFTLKVSEALVKSGNSLKQAGNQMLRVVTLPIGGLGVAAVKLATDAEAAAARLDLVFGPQLADKLRETFRSLRKEIPATSAELQNFASRVGEVFIPLGILPQKATKARDGVDSMAVEFIKLSKALAVLNPGRSAEETFNALINATVGRTIELSKLGIVVRQQTINEFALRAANEALNESMGTSGKVYRSTASELTQGEKAYGAYLAIRQRGILIENAVAFAQNTLNLQLLFAKAAIKEAGISVGTVLLPVMTRLSHVVRDVADAIAELPRPTIEMAINFAKWAAIIGPLLIVAGNLFTTLGKLGLAFKAIKAALEASSILALGGAFGSLLAALLPILTIIGLIIVSWRLYVSATNDANDATQKYQRTLESLSASQIDREQARVQLQTTLRKAELEQIKRHALERTRIESEPSGFGKTMFALAEAGGDKVPQRKLEAKFTAEETQRIRELNDVLTDLGQKRDALDKQAAVIEAKNAQRAAQEKVHAEELKAIQEDVAKETLAQRLAREREEWQTLNANINAAIASLRVSRRLGEETTEPLRRLRDLLNEVNEARNKLDVTPKKEAQLESLADRIKLAIAGPASQDPTRLEVQKQRQAMQLFALDVRVAVRELNNAAKAGIDITKPLETVNDLVTEINRRMLTIGLDPKVNAEYKILRLDLEGAAEAAKKVDIAGLTSRARLDVETLKDLTEKATKGTTTERAALTQDLLSGIQRVSQDEADISDMLKRQVGTAKQRNDLQREMINLTNQQKDAAEAVVTQLDLFTPGLESNLEQLAAVLSQRKLQLDLELRIPKNDEAVRQARASISAVQEAIGQVVSDSLKSGLFKFLDAKGQADVIEAIDKLFKKLGIDSTTFNAQLEKTDRLISRLAIGARGLAAIFESFGLTKFNELSRGIFNSIDALKQLRAAEELTRNRIRTQGERNPFDTNTSANIQELSAAISGFTGIVGGIFTAAHVIDQAFFGLNETEKEHISIIKQNNERLAEMTLAVEGFNGSARDQLRVAAALRSPAVRTAADTLFSGQSLESVGLRAAGSSIQQFNKQIAQFGITFEQINKLAKDNGITLLDSKGRVVAAAFDQLAKAIELQLKLNFLWQNGMGGTIVSLRDLRDSVDLLNDVMNVADTPQRAIDQALNELQTLAPKLFEQFFGGIDLTDVNAVEKALQALTLAFFNNALDFDKLGGIIDKSELISIIQLMAGGFDKLRDAVDSVTESVLNVPTWFKTQQVRFESVAAMTTPGAVPGTTTPGVTPTGTAPSNDVNIGNLTVVVDASQAADGGAAFADDFIEQLRNRNFLRTGSSSLDSTDGL